MSSRKVLLFSNFFPGWWIFARPFYRVYRGGNQSCALWGLFSFFLSSSSFIFVSISRSLLFQFLALRPRFSWSFFFFPFLSRSPGLSCFCLALHTYAAAPSLGFPALFFPLPRSLPPCFFFPPLSPGNQTSGEECWVSTFPEKRTIWATQRPTMDPLCSLLPALCRAAAARAHAHTENRANYIRIHTPCSCYSFSSTRFLWLFTVGIFSFQFFLFNLILTLVPSDSLGNSLLWLTRCTSSM